MDWSALRPDELPPVDPDEFATAFNLVINAAAGRVALQHRLGDADAEQPGAGRHWALPDRPLTRGLAALRERYADPLKFNNVAYRIAAVTFAVVRPELQPYLRPHPTESGSRLVHPAVIDAAAISPLAHDFEFELPAYLENVRRIARERYADW